MDVLAIISRLGLEASDGRSLEAVRHRHDPQHVFVDAHVTHVFPFEGVKAVVAAAHAAGVARRTPALDFRLTAAKALNDPLTGAWLVFLFFGEGESGIAALHDDLYSGPLEEKLRRDLPYRPHVTVGRFERLGEAQGLVESLGAVDLRGRIASIDLVEFDGRRLLEIERFALGARP